MSFAFFQDITQNECFQMTEISQGYNLIASHEIQYPRQKQSEFDQFTLELIFTDEMFSANFFLAILTELITNQFN